MFCRDSKRIFTNIEIWNYKKENPKSLVNVHPPLVQCCIHWNILFKMDASQLNWANKSTTTEQILRKNWTNIEQKLNKYWANLELSAPVNSRMMIVQPCEHQHQPLFLNRKTGSFTKEKSKENFLKRNLRRNICLFLKMVTTSSEIF